MIKKGGRLNKDHPNDIKNKNNKNGCLNKDHPNDIRNKNK